MQPFGTQLRNLRHDRNLSLRQLSDSVGLSRSYLLQIEHGDVPFPKYEHIVSIALGLNVPVDDLLLQVGRLPADVYWLVLSHFQEHPDTLAELRNAATV
jgi:transcriptional regulator with XRE-family HTH domain